MRGQPVEALAECEAMQRDAETAQLLGASPTEAIELARAYWSQSTRTCLRRTSRRTAQLVAPLDEHLPDPPWTRGDYVRRHAARGRRG